jgi:hypothetical protein
MNRMNFFFLMQSYGAFLAFANNGVKYSSVCCDTPSVLRQIGPVPLFFVVRKVNGLR